MLAPRKFLSHSASRRGSKFAKGALCLALQGMGTEEAEAFSLRMEEDGLLRQLAGNAFCANLCLVALIAALLYS